MEALNQRENWEGLWIGNNRKERHGLLKEQVTQLNWIPATDNRTWSNNETIYWQRSSATKSILKTQNVFKNTQLQTHGHKGLLWTAGFSRGGHRPRMGREGVPTSAEVSPKGLSTLPRSGWKHRWLCIKEICTAAQFPGRVSTCQTLAGAAEQS